MSLGRSRSSPREGCWCPRPYSVGTLTGREHWASWITTCWADTKGQRQWSTHRARVEAWADRFQDSGVLGRHSPHLTWLLL